MFKLKNFKYLLLLMLFAFVGQNAWGGDGYWMYMHIQVDSYPTAAGKVYASSSQSSAQNSNNCVASPYITHVSTAEANINSGKTLWYINTIPVDATKWAFVGWVKNPSENTDFYNTTYESTDRNPSNGFADPGSYASSTADGKGGKVSHSNSTYYIPDPFPITLRMTAVYRSIKPDVVAVSNNGELGATEFSDANNSVGETVVLSATPAHYNSKFEGWYKDGALISKENPFSFTVTDENKGTYTAHFVEHKFMRIYNNSTNRYINGVNDVGSITNFSSLQLESNKDATRYQAGTVIYMWDYTRTSPSAHPYVFDIQGFSSKSYYDDTNGVYVIILHDNDSDTWTISSSDKSTYMSDKGGTSVEPAAVNAGFPLDWKFEHIDNDLETQENYFSLDPDKLVEVDGKYYTTLRTSWNILFNPEQMTPYVVTSVDEETGTFEMEPITGNIIPLGTPVIIETKSNDVEENRMVPTTTAFTGTKPATNLLQTSEKYFPNQSVSGNYKALMVNGEGQLAFGGDALTTVNGNEAYLIVTQPVTWGPIEELPTATTLYDLLRSGDTENTYNVTDLTCVYALDNVLYCKDNDNALSKSTPNTGEVDYLRDVATLQEREWDQSNWIALVLPDGVEATLGLIDHRLKNVEGRLTNTVNPEFAISKLPDADEENPYTENVFITCNFVKEHQTNVQIHNEIKNCFFVAPKPMEIAQVEWAMWDMENEKFVLPSNNSNTGLEGEFYANFSLLDSQPTLTSAGYHFLALIRKESVTASVMKGIAPRAEGEEPNRWMVYPLEWSNNTVTSISLPSISKTLSGVKYYNLVGAQSNHPFPGINIVVREYSDGSRETTKIVK